MMDTKYYETVHGVMANYTLMMGDTSILTLHRLTLKSRLQLNAWPIRQTCKLVE